MTYFSYRLEQIGRIEKPEKHGEYKLVEDDQVYYKARRVCDMHRNSLKLSFTNICLN